MIKLERILYTKRKLILFRVCKRLLTFLFWSFLSKINAFHKPELITRGNMKIIFVEKGHEKMRFVS